MLETNRWSNSRYSPSWVACGSILSSTSKRYQAPLAGWIPGPVGAFCIGILFLGISICAAEAQECSSGRATLESTASTTTFVSRAAVAMLPSDTPAERQESSELISESLVYKTVDDRELKLYVDKPADWQAANKRPAIVFFFGGGWVGGTPEHFAWQANYFASRGMVAIRVEYRVIPKGDNGPPIVCCHDAKSAMRYVREHANDLGIDPDRIAAAGGSAGGHLAAFASMVDGTEDPDDNLDVSPRGNALVLFNPVFDNGPDGGWGHQRVQEQYRSFSPAHNISEDDPPAIVFLGGQDKLMDVSVLERFQTKMQQAGVRCDTKIYDHVGHGFFNKSPYREQTIVAADRFLASLDWIDGEPTLRLNDK